VPKSPDLKIDFLSFSLNETSDQFFVRLKPSFHSVTFNVLGLEAGTHVGSHPHGGVGLLPQPAHNKIFKLLPPCADAAQLSSNNELDRTEVYRGVIILFQVVLQVLAAAQWIACHQN
jgi:hypothetical protein